MNRRISFAIGRLTVGLLTLFMAQKAAASEFLTAMPSAANPTAVLSVDASLKPKKDYISLAESGLKKYYPQWEEYFRSVMKVMKDIKNNKDNPQAQDYLNGIIEDNFNIFNDDLKNEKDSVTTILMFYEKILSQEKFTRDKQVEIIDKDEEVDLREELAKDIYYDILGPYKSIIIMGVKYHSVFYPLEILLKKESDNVGSLSNSEIIQLLGLIEKLLELENEYHLTSDKKMIPIIKCYKIKLEEMNRKPSPLGEAWIKKLLKE